MPFQSPKGTRDFYPAEMAIRRYIEGVWRDVSVLHGYEEVDGPTFEHLDLYTVKSGPGIVSELFSFRRAGGDTDYALRPEFTPTLARMVAARAAQLPHPIKWYSMPAMFRAERPQRGRLREHLQWNVDLIGDPTPAAEAELIAVAVAALRRWGLTASDVQVRMSHRGLVSELLIGEGVPPDRLPEAFALLDKRDKIPAEQFVESAGATGLSAAGVELFSRQAELMPLTRIADGGALSLPPDSPVLNELRALLTLLETMGLTEWCRFDLGIVRGLAYYTGVVFEIHEATGRERAVAGGGRYDNLVELFGGPPTPAVGFAMGDVVIRLVLEEHGLLEPAEHYLPRPDAFVISAGAERAEQCLPGLVARLRSAGLHVRHTYRSTRNVKKLLGEASRCRSRLAIILDDELSAGKVIVKDLDGGVQNVVAVDELEEVIGQGLGVGD